MAKKQKKQSIEAVALPPSPQDALAPYPYVYDACCERCGVKLGDVSFPAERPDWDPRAAGLACAGCLEPIEETPSVIEGVV